MITLSDFQYILILIFVLGTPKVLIALKEFGIFALSSTIGESWPEMSDTGLEKSNSSFSIWINSSGLKQDLSWQISKRRIGYFGILIIDFEDDLYYFKLNCDTSVTPLWRKRIKIKRLSDQSITLVIEMM